MDAKGKKLFWNLRQSASMRRWLFALAIFLLLPIHISGEDAEPASLKISGYGLLGNFELKSLVKTLNDKKKPEFFRREFH
jgi:hypothetical protein